MTKHNSRTTTRQKRVPIHKQGRLDVTNKDPNYIYRIVNDSEGRIDSFKRAGYEVVGGGEEFENSNITDASQMGSVKKLVVNRGRDASSRHGVLMRIPKELYEEDQKAKQEEIDLMEAERSPELVAQNPNNGFYGGKMDKS